MRILVENVGREPSLLRGKWASLEEMKRRRKNTATLRMRRRKRRRVAGVEESVGWFRTFDVREVRVELREGRVLGEEVGGGRREERREERVFKCFRVERRSEAIRTVQKNMEAK